jgi:hypothetical protein
MKINPKHLKVFAVSYALYFIIIIFILKYTGFVNKFTTAYFEPYSWSEIIKIIPNLAIISLIAAIFSTLLIEEGKKQKEKEKKEQEEKSAQDNPETDR